MKGWQVWGAERCEETVHTLTRYSSLPSPLNPSTTTPPPFHHSHTQHPKTNSHPLPPTCLNESSVRRLLCRKARLLSSLRLSMSPDSGSSRLLLVGASAPLAPAPPPPPAPGREAPPRPPMLAVGGSRLLARLSADRLLVRTAGEDERETKRGGEGRGGVRQGRGGEKESESRVSGDWHKQAR